MFERTPAILVAVVAIAAVLAHGEASHALPPSSVTGIDLQTVLTVDERARLAEFGLLDEDHSDESLRHVRTIVLDPGHGGENDGAISVEGVKEKYLTLEIAYQLRDRIHDKYPDVRVILTRYWDRDLGLSERIHFANNVGADLFLSLHYNAAVHKRAVGFETYFLESRQATPGQQDVKGEPIATASTSVTGIEEDTYGDAEGPYNSAMTALQRDLERAKQHKESGLLASVVNRHLDRQLRTRNRGVKQANFAVLRGALMPAVVVEAGFLTHPSEGKKVFEESHQRRVTSALLRAVENFDQQLAKRADAK